MARLERMDAASVLREMWDGTAYEVGALPIAAVLRSWEERFGARLVEVGFAEIRLLVQPPAKLALPVV